MTDEIKKLIADVEGRINNSANQITQLSQMLDEASVNHQRLLGERAGYEKLLKALESSNKEGECNED
ncbi:MAG: hypothetical protein J6K64_03165 [Clostridia bacterium]|nr:hypothetical protein [Clostridia bacterium]